MTDLTTPPPVEAPRKERPLTGRGLAGFVEDEGFWLGHDEAFWQDFWQRVRDREVPATEAERLFTYLAGGALIAESIGPFLEALSEHGADRQPIPHSVNVVGTGGGPSTFNVSTAASFVAAAAGVPIVKTGSRAYSSRRGSVDMLERLGVTVSTNDEHLAQLVDEFGIGFAGSHVYPVELRQLARLVFPASMRPFGRFLNAVGPFLGDVPAESQVTGVSAPGVVDELGKIPSIGSRCRVWLMDNDAGIDELVPFATNRIVTAGAPDMVIKPWVGEGADECLRELRPVDDDRAVHHFRRVISGQGNFLESLTVSMNAALIILASDSSQSWATAVKTASQVLESGAAGDLLCRIRAASRTSGKRLAR